LLRGRRQPGQTGKHRSKQWSTPYSVHSTCFILAMPRKPALLLDPNRSSLSLPGRRSSHPRQQYYHHYRRGKPNGPLLMWRTSKPSALCSSTSKPVDTTTTSERRLEFATIPEIQTLRRHRLLIIVLIDELRGRNGDLWFTQNQGSARRSPGGTQTRTTPAAQMMRRILVDYARAQVAVERGALSPRVSLVEAENVGSSPAFEVIAVGTALERLAELDPEQARVVELRFFSGLTVEEIAHGRSAASAVLGKRTSAACDPRPAGAVSSHACRRPSPPAARPCNQNHRWPRSPVLWRAALQSRRELASGNPRRQREGQLKGK